MNFVKKMICAFLVACMVFSMVPAAAAAETDAVQAAEGRILLDGSVQGSVWIDGKEYANQGGYVDLPAGSDAKTMVTYTYHVGDAQDIHTQYPTGMQVWTLEKNDDGSYTSRKVEGLENILHYSGSSIRITGVKGIRMITSIDLDKKSALVSQDGLDGFTLLEYGTVLSWASDLAGGNPLVLGPEYAKHNYAYKKDVADPVFKVDGNKMQYTNVLVGFSLDQCADDIAMRSYMILETPEGEQVTIYGGILYRSIGYIAWQNRHAFKPGSAADKYVWDIIRYVYGDIYDVTFNSNGGTEIPGVEVFQGDLLPQPEDPVLEGETFGGWYTDEGLRYAYDFSAPVYSDLNLHAMWEQTLTRGQWIQELVDAYGYPTDSAEGQSNYSDIADSTYRTAIETAVIYNILTPDGQERFRPDEPATRQFAAETAVNAMGYQPEGALDCLDSDDIDNLAAAGHAVDMGWLDLEEGYFHPNRTLLTSEASQILAGIEGTFDSADGGEDSGDGIVFLDGVVNKEGPFDWEMEGDKIIVPDDEEIPQDGQIITFGTDKAIRVEGVETVNGKTRIGWSKPEMYEYLDRIDVQGTGMLDFANFIPAEGVTVTTNTAPAIMPFGFADDWFDVPAGSVGTGISTTLEGDVDLGGGWAFNYSLELNIPTVSYKFDVNFDANPFNDVPPVNVKNAYIKMQNDITVHVDIGNGFDTSDEEWDDNPYDDILEKEIPLGNVPLIGVNGLGAVIELDLVVTAEGKFELDYNVHGTLGIQVLNNRPRNISALQSSYSIGLAATITVGPRIGLEVEIFDEDILDCYAEAGVAVEGSIHYRSTGLVCIDANTHIYAKLVAFEDCLIDDWLDISIGYDIWDADNSPIKEGLHWENLVKVDECTYNTGGTIKGTVVNADNRSQHIEDAKIQVYNSEDMALLKTVYTDENGEYTVHVKDGGTVLIRISADGYIPFDTLQTVGSSQLVYLETALMVEGSEDSNETGLVSGKITDAVSGNGIPRATLIIRKGWNMTSGTVIKTVYTNSSGKYTVELPLGNYTIAVEREGYIPTHFNVAATSLGNDNCNATMNPDGSNSVELGDMRIILTWADEPRDLDSHLWGPTVNGDGMFHTYYSNKNYYYNGTKHAFLDRDDIDYVGPETTTVYNMTDNGVYSFYVHDYTNRNRTGSTVMANSGAYIQVYVGSERVAVYHVPTSGVGNVWHVFDFDAVNGRIIPVNEFWDCSNTSQVGSPFATIAEEPEELKDYEKSEAPTEDPTEEPAQDPIEDPTEEPAQDPIEDPTEEPAQEPTEGPTEEPTEGPTEEPTEEPAEEPTGEPTGDPAEEPDPGETL